MHKGKIVGDTECPRCRENGHDSSGNHLLIFEDGGRYCGKGEYHKDGKPYIMGDKGTEAPVSPPKRTLSKVGRDMAEIQDLPVAALTGRMIAKDIAQHYGIRVEYSEENGQERAYHYPITQKGKVVAYKSRYLPKEFAVTGKSLKGQKIELLGQHVCPKSGLKLLITEGQDDMAAACQMLWRKYPNFTPNVVSLVHGTAISSIADNLDFINGFKEVILCFDNDDPGQKASKDAAQLVGSKARIMSFSEKDCNDMLKKGKQKEFINAFFSAVPYAPEGFITVDDVFDEATTMPTYGKKWCWPSLTKLTYGRRLGEGIYFGSGVKIGKSEAVNQIAHHITQVEKGSVALFKLEEKPSMTVRKIAGKIMHKQFHVPDGDFTQEELIEGVNKVRDGVVLYDSYGSTSWDKLKAAIRHAVMIKGCQDIIIDPLTRLTTGMNSADANVELERVSDELSKMAKDLGFFYMVFAHLKSPQSGKSHEAGGKVQSNQFTGSRSMMRACYYMVGIERDKSLEDEIERNTSTFVLLEDRAFGNSGAFPVFYDRNTGDYLEPVRTVGEEDY